MTAVRRHTSHVTRHTSHRIQNTSRVTRHVTRLMSNLGFIQFIYKCSIAFPRFFQLRRCLCKIRARQLQRSVTYKRSHVTRCHMSHDATCHITKPTASTAAAPRRACLQLHHNCRPRRRLVSYCAAVGMEAPHDSARRGDDVCIARATVDEAEMADERA